MKRKLLIVTSSSTLGAATVGVTEAANSLLDYYKSPCGGAWENDEIKQINLSSYPNPNAYLKNEVRELNELYDYSVIIFIGHGARTEFSADYIQTSPISVISVIDLCEGLATEEQKHHIRRTVIVDSCRSFLSQSAIASMITESELRDELDREECRNYYNAQVMSLPCHIDLIQSTDPYNYAYCLANSTMFVDGVSQFLRQNIKDFKRLAMSPAGFVYSNKRMIDDVKCIIGDAQIPTLGSNSCASYPFFAAIRPASSDKKSGPLLD